MSVEVRCRGYATAYIPIEPGTWHWLRCRPFWLRRVLVLAAGRELGVGAIDWRLFESVRVRR